MRFLTILSLLFCLHHEILGDIADHVVINEVYYDVAGSDEAEFVELYNPTEDDVNLSGWYFGDEEDTTGYEGYGQFPPGTVIPAQGYLLVAKNSTAFAQAFGFTPDVEMTFALNNGGDEILLGQEDHAQYVDVVTYENGSFSGVIAHPGVPEGHSIERNPHGEDTDDCSVDFQDLSVPTPQGLGGVRIIRVYFSKSVEADFATTQEADGGVDLGEKVAARIDSAQYSVDCCVYNLTLWDVRDALIAALNRGVEVRFITDDTKRGNAEVQALENAGIPVIDDSFGQNTGGGIMHNKFLVVDHRLGDDPEDDWVLTGSFNFSYGGNLYDANNVVEFRSSTLAAAYTQEFEEMWGSSTLSPDPADSRFGSRKSDNTPHSFTVDSILIEQYMSPTDDVTQRILDAIATADYEIFFCIYTFTRQGISDGMKVKWDDDDSYPDFRVQAVFDSSQALDPYWGQYSEYWDLSGQGGGNPWNPPAEVFVDGIGNGLLHHKYMIIDGEHPDSDPILITGSHNWTSAAENENDENTLIIHDSNIANLYIQEFKARFYEAGGEETVREKKKDKASAFWLSQNYPNPFNSSTIIPFGIPKHCRVRITIYNSLGQEVSVLVNGFKRRGIYQEVWDSDYQPSGIYFYVIEINNFIKAGKMTLLK